MHGVKADGRMRALFDEGTCLRADGTIDWLTYLRRDGSEWVASHVQYALVAPDGRRIPIRFWDLGNWLIRFFQMTPGNVTRRGRNPRLTLREGIERKETQDATVAGSGESLAPAPGDWWVIASDGEKIAIPHLHASTAVEALTFQQNGGRVVAKFGGNHDEG